MPTGQLQYVKEVPGQQIGPLGALYQNATPLLTGIGAIVVIVLLAIKLFGIKISTFSQRAKSNNADDDNDRDYVAGVRYQRRRHNDELLNILVEHTRAESEYQSRLTAIMERLSDLHREIVRLLERHDDKIEERLDKLERTLNKLSLLNPEK